MGLINQLITGPPHLVAILDYPFGSLNLGPQQLFRGSRHVGASPSNSDFPRRIRWESDGFAVVVGMCKGQSAAWTQGDWRSLEWGKRATCLRQSSLLKKSIQPDQLNVLIWYCRYLRMQYIYIYTNMYIYIYTYIYILHYIAIYLVMFI